MKLLVTGASGFVGWNAVRYFEGRGCSIIGTYNQSKPHCLHLNYRFVRLDLAERTAADEIVARFQPDFILHAAALARPQRSDTSRLYDVNVHGTERLVRAARRCGAVVIYLSTDLVYPEDAGHCDEDTPTVPSGAGEYSRTKLQGEQAVCSEAERWVVLRPSLMFGDGTPGSNSFTQFIDRKWAAGEPAPLFTDQFRSVLYVGDLCRAIDAVIEKEQWNRTFVCGGAERISRAEFGLRYADACGVDRSMCRPMRAEELPGYVGGPSDLTLKTDRLQRTGWQPRPLTECFSEMLRRRSQAG